MNTPQKNYDAVVASPVGPLGILMEEDVLLEVDFLPRGSRLHKAKNSHAQRVVDQLHAYFSDPKVQFTLPLRLKGTRFQQKVWKAMQKIPSGKPMSYGDLAHKLGTSARAIGGACRANPIPVIVPCHRVIATSGLGGFAGHTRGDYIRIKQQLLAHEGFESQA